MGGTGGVHLKKCSEGTVQGGCATFGGALSVRRVCVALGAGMCYLRRQGGREGGSQMDCGRQTSGQAAWVWSITQQRAGGGSWAAAAWSAVHAALGSGPPRPLPQCLHLPLCLLLCLLRLCGEAPAAAPAGSAAAAAQSSRWDAQGMPGRPAGCLTPQSRLASRARSGRRWPWAC